MSKQLINTGTITNDGTGDTLRTGAQKVNENFTELYSLLTSNDSLTVVNQITAGAGITLDNTTGTVTITNNLANTHSFGSVHVGASTINSASQGETLNLVAGTSMTITANTGTKTLTFAVNNMTGTVNGLTYPSSVGTAGQVLTSVGNGIVGWGNVLASQTGNANRLLTTTGTSTSWTSELSVSGSRITTTANSTLNLVGKAGQVTNVVGSGDVQLQWIGSGSLATVTGNEAASTNYVFVNSAGTHIETINAQSQGSVWLFSTDGNLYAPSTAGIVTQLVESGSSLQVVSDGALTIGTGNSDTTNGSDITIQAGTATFDFGGNITIQAGAGNLGGEVTIKGGQSTGGISADVIISGGDQYSGGVQGRVLINGRTCSVGAKLLYNIDTLPINDPSNGNLILTDDQIFGNIFVCEPLLNNKTITLPQPSADNVGFNFIIKNYSATYTITIKNSAGTTVTVIPAQGQGLIVNDGRSWFKV